MIKSVYLFASLASSYAPFRMLKIVMLLFISSIFFICPILHRHVRERSDIDKACFYSCIYRNHKKMKKTEQTPLIATVLKKLYAAKNRQMRQTDFAMSKDVAIMGKELPTEFARQIGWAKSCVICGQWVLVWRGS